MLNHAALKEHHTPKYFLLMEWILTLAALAYLVIYSWQIISQPTGRALQISEVILMAIWVFFLMEYLVRLYLAHDRRTWFTRHLFDLVVVILPILRPLRVLRVLMILGVIQRSANLHLHGRIAAYTTVGSALLVWLSALTVLDLERGVEGSSLTTMSEALWWAFVTVTTVGYGDIAPVTDEGRLVAVILMLAGISLIGIVTATLASWVVAQASDEEAALEGANRGMMDEAPAADPQGKGERGRQAMGCSGECAATKADVEALRRDIERLREEVLRLKKP